MTITRDALSGWYCPANAAEWTQLLAGTGIANPSMLLTCQDTGAAGTVTLPDQIGTFNGSAVASFPAGWQVAVPGWSRVGILLSNGGAQYIKCLQAGLPDISVASCLVFGYVLFPASSTVSFRSVLTLGSTFGKEVTANLNNSSKLVGSADPNTVAGTSTTFGAVHPLLVQVNRTAGSAVIQTDQETLTPALTATPLGKGIVVGGDNTQWWFAGGTVHLYLCAWFNAAAELDSTGRALLLNVLQNGPLVNNWPYTNRLPEFRCTKQRAGFIEVVLTATPAASEWTSLDLFVSGRPGRAPSRNRS